jgi:hypothetical protein
MATDVDICNSALIYLGVEQIGALNETTKQAVLCNLKYPKVKTRLLKQHPWNFTIKRDTLTDNGNSPDHEFGFEFDMPANCLRILQVYDYYDDYGYRIESNKILANTATLKVKYIEDVAESEFPEDFAELLALELAIDLSYFLVQSEPVRAGLRQLHAERLRDCRSIDAQEGTPEDPNADEFIKARW